MLVSYLLRLVDSEAALGHLVGEIEDVQTGETRVFRSSVELARIVRDSRPQPSSPHPPTTEPPSWTREPDPSSD